MSESRTLRIGHEKAFLFLSDEYDGASTRGRVDGELWAMRTRLRVPQLDASALVHLSAHDAQETLLPAFFAELGASWRGWAGVKEWRARETGLALACTHDGRGTISMDTELRDLNLDWVARAVVPIDAGQLEQLALDVERFFAP